MKKPELTELIDATARQVAETLAKSSLAKADPGEETPAEKKPAGSSTEGSKDGGQTASSAPADKGSDGGESSPPAHKEPDGDEGAPGPGDGDADNSAPAAPTDGAPAPDAGDMGAGDPAADADAGVGSLEEQYAALPVNELVVHMQALQAAIAKQLGGAGGTPPPAPVSDAGSAPAPAPAAPAPAAPSAPPPGMGKKEFAVDEASGGSVTGGKMVKSENSVEARIQALEAQNASLKKSLEEKDALMAKNAEMLGQAAAGLTQVIQKSDLARKAVTGLTFKPAATETQVTLTKSEILAKCKELSAKPDLQKSDRIAINQYVAGGAPVTVIEHLLKK